MSIVEFPKPLNRVWVCNCGCSTFELYDDETHACSACGTRSDNEGRWFTPPDDAPETDDEPFRDVHGNGSTEFARRRLQQMASDDDAALLVVRKLDGQVSVWAAVETADQRDWCVEGVETAIDLMRKWDIVDA